MAWEGRRRQLEKAEMTGVGRWPSRVSSDVVASRHTVLKHKSWVVWGRGLWKRWRNTVGP